MELPRLSQDSKRGADHRILAVVVTFNPDAELLENLRQLKVQVDDVLVIDNASDNPATVAAAAMAAGCDLVKNPCNLGVAGALNQAADLAKQKGFEWLWTFDQDSRVAPGAAPALLKLAEAYIGPRPIGVIATSHRDRISNKDYHLPGDICQNFEDFRVVKTTITSGSLYRREIFDVVGIFEERLFIDAVDHEFCLRCRKFGYFILESKAAMISHSLGSPQYFFGGRIKIGNYSPQRLYYINRNHLFILLRYIGTDFSFVVLRMMFTIFNDLAVLAFQQKRRANLTAMVLGFMHCVSGKFGDRQTAILS